MTDTSAPPLVADRYRPVRELSRGGEGVVWLAEDTHLSLDVVLKVRDVTDPAQLQQLRREAATLMRVVAHPGLPVVRNDVVDGDRYCLVSDYVRGTDLHDLVTARDGGGLALARALDVVDQVAAALDHLHGHRPAIVHGDVKPENVVLTEDDHVVLVDFGTALRDGDTGEQVGSPGYSAPEVLAGEVVGPQSDVYSLAATTVFVLTGQVPRLGSDWPEALARADLQRLERVLRRSLTWDPAGRPRSATEFAGRLREAAEMELPTGTVSIVLVDADGGGRPSALVDELERRGGRVAAAVTAPASSAVVVFARANDAVDAAMAVTASSDGPITVHAGDLGGWHGATLQQLVDDAADLRRHAPPASVVCSPPVRMLVGGSSAWTFERLANGLRVTTATATTTDHSVRQRRQVERWLSARRARPIAGRDHELATALAALDRATEVSPLVLVAGDAGIGKTRLIAEIAGRAAERGAQILVGRCTEAGGAFEPFLDALGDEAFPFDHGRVERDEEGWVDRRRFFGQIADSIDAIGDRVVLVIDDLQWVDGSSIALLRQLADELAGKLAVVAGARSTPFVDTIEELAAEATTTAIRLTPLDREGLGRLAAGVGVAVDGATLDDLHALTGGSPFFGLQLLQHLQESPGGRLDADGLPVGIRDWILHRVDRLGDGARATLAPAAVIGPGFEAVTLAEILGLSPLDVVGHLDRAVADGLLVDGEHAGEFRFVHALVRAALEDSVSPARRALLHAAAAARIELTADDLESLEEALHHWFEADRLGDPIHTAQLATDVAERTTERLAHERATDLLDRALELLVTSPAGPERDRAEAQLRLAHGRADVIASDLDTAIDQLYRAADLAEAADDDTTLADAALVASLNRRHGRDEPELLALIERASERCPEEPAVLSAMLHVRRARLLPAAVPHEERSAMARRGLELVDRMDRIDRATVEIEVARACWGPDDAADREELTTRHIAEAELALRRGGPSRWAGVLIDALGHRTGARVQLGDLVGALQDADRAAALADEAGSTFLLTRMMMSQAMIHTALGHHDLAERLAADAVTMSGRHNLVLVQMTITYAIGRDRGQQAVFAALEHELDEFVDRNPLFTAGFGLAHAEAGHVDDARRVLRTLHEMTPWPRNWLWLAATTAALETAAIVGDTDATRRYTAVLGRYSGQWALGGAELGCWGPVDRALGIGHAALGRPDEGRRLLERARRDAAAQGALPWVDRCDAALAEISAEQ